MASSNGIHENKTETKKDLCASVKELSRGEMGGRGERDLPVLVEKTEEPVSMI